MRTLKLFLTILYSSSLILLGYLLFNYSPSTAGPAGILFFFILLYISTVGIIFFIMRIMYLAVGSILKFFFKKDIKSHLNSSSMFYYSLLFSTIPIFIIAFRSVGEVGFTELILIAIFELLGVFYLKKKVLA